MGIGFLVTMITAQDLPIGKHRFDDVHGNGFLLVIAHADFEPGFVKIVGELAPVGLLALADNVKGVAPS